MVYRGMSNYYKKIPDDYKRMFEDFNIPKEVFFNHSLDRDIEQNIYFYPVYILDGNLPFRDIVQSLNIAMCEKKFFL